MQPLRSKLLLLLVAGVALAQSSDNPLDNNPKAYQAANKLKCLCGCPMTVASCTMVKCGYGDPARHKVAALSGQGKTEDQILASFVQDKGKAALAEPPISGFNSLGLLAPITAVLAGASALFFFLQRVRRRPATPAGPVVVNPALDRYRSRIDEELDKLD